MSTQLTRSVRDALRGIPLILERDLYTTDAAVMAELDVEYRDVRAAMGILYAQRRADRVLGYIVTPAAPVTERQQAA